MGSQFVDFNADGHLDYLTATFDGSPHIAYGSAQGYKKPVRLKDRNGERILIRSYWCYENKKHLDTDRANPTGDGKQRCISALAYDWDADGDYDLLLGSYEEGRLYRQMNEGTNAEPQFTGQNIAVNVGDAPLNLSAKMTTPRLVDWDQDGDADLIFGTFGDSYGQNGKGGGVYLSLNQGTKGKPKFGALQTLIVPSPKGHKSPTRPDAGLYPEAVDYDGDGDLDLVVGAYSMWTPAGRVLTAPEKARLAELRAEQKAVQAEYRGHSQQLSKELAAATQGIQDKSSAEARAKTQAVLAKFKKRTRALSTKLGSMTREISKLAPGPKRTSFVWLYERL